MSSCGWDWGVLGAKRCFSTIANVLHVAEYQGLRNLGVGYA